MPLSMTIEARRARAFDREPRRRLLPRLVLLLMCTGAPMEAAAQDTPRAYAGGMFGVSALSADAATTTGGSDAAVALYDPANGPAVNLFAGVHVSEYFAVQANWMWNRNDLTLTATRTGPGDDGYFVQHRSSGQHAAVFDGLLYFRRLDSVVRPYLGTGLSVVRFSSSETHASDGTLPAPPREAASTRIGLRSHVGIDLRVSRCLAFRYSFSETISGNPISPMLTPPGRRGLMNFQNLFGFVGMF